MFLTENIKEDFYYNLTHFSMLNRTSSKTNETAHGNIEYILEIPFCPFWYSEVHSKYTPGGL